MLNSVVSLIPILGVVGIGVSTPIIYERVSANNFTTSWNRKLEKDSYLLGSCRKDIKGQSYNIELYLSNDESGGGEDSYNRGLGLTHFVKADQQNFYGGWTLKGDQSGTAKLEMSAGIVKFGEEDWDDFQNECSMQHVIAPKDSGHIVRDSEIAFECDEQYYGFGKKGCDIKFSEENKFTFKEDLKSKLKYWAFYSY